MGIMTGGSKPCHNGPCHKGARWVTWILRIGFLGLFTMLMSTGRLPVWDVACAFGHVMQKPSS